MGMTFSYMYTIQCYCSQITCMTFNSINKCQYVWIDHPRHYNTYLMYLRVSIVMSCDVMVGQVISLQIYIF